MLVHTIMLEPVLYVQLSIAQSAKLILVLFVLMAIFSTVLITIVSPAHLNAKLVRAANLAEHALQDS